MSTHKSLAEALAAFQAALPHVGKDNLAVVKSDKGQYKYTYANLADVSARVLPALAAVGLSFSAKPTLTEDGRFVLRYTLRHVSGETDTGDYPLPTGTAQQVGSAITYARRYALTAVTGVAPDQDDDDGQAAQQAGPAAVAPVDPVEAAKARLRASIRQNNWNATLVAERYSDEHGGVSLRDADDAGEIDRFRSSLFSVPDGELRAPNGVPA